jgi:hypothetical protein
MRTHFQIVLTRRMAASADMTRRGLQQQAFLGMGCGARSVSDTPHTPNNSL